MPIEVDIVIVTLLDHGTPIVARLQIEGAAAHCDASVTDRHTDWIALLSFINKLVNEVSQLMKLRKVSLANDMTILRNANLRQHERCVDHVQIVVHILLFTAFTEVVVV